MTYFRTGGHYHRPCELNGRVRNGNGCFLTGKVTGKSAGARSPALSGKWQKSKWSNRLLMEQAVNQSGQAFAR